MPFLTVGLLPTLLTAHRSLHTAHCSPLTAHCSLLTAHCSLRWSSVLHLHNLCFAGPIDCDDIHIIELSFRYRRKLRTTQCRDNLRHSCVVTGNKNGLP